MTDKPQLFWDTRGDQPNEIVSYIHCGKCLDEWRADEVLFEMLSPKEYADTQTGLTDDGSIQVWCNRHEMNVMIFSGKDRTTREGN